MRNAPTEDDIVVHEAAWVELDPSVAYRIAALRNAVFVVEQRCAYLDLDGRDLEADCRQLWIQADDGEVVAALRVLREPDGSRRIGRVVTAAACRRNGLAARLMERAVEPPGPIVLDAQSYLASWYGGFGFVVTGPLFMEDGIPHTPMRRP